MKSWLISFLIAIVLVSASLAALCVYVDRVEMADDGGE